MGCVLIVDDAATVRQQVTLALGSANINVVDAEDAPSAFAQLENSPDIKLMIVDLNLPGMNGFELIERVVHERGAEAPPMLILTTEHSSRLLHRAREVGAAGWLSKPVATETLIEAVRQLML